MWDWGLWNSQKILNFGIYFKKIWNSRELFPKILNSRDFFPKNLKFWGFIPKNPKFQGFIPQKIWISRDLFPKKSEIPRIYSQKSQNSKDLFRKFQLFIPKIPRIYSQKFPKSHEFSPKSPGFKLKKGKIWDFFGIFKGIFGNFFF